ncbi:MAG: dihydropteroate synthase [Micropruina sp.]|uniref:dihydropteroate synthase n=1 Tax=Micropruina sp. TaxID=2737536 RepID=UPI0039E445A4
MGIVNVTPDSFSDGGDFASTQAAIEHGRALLAEGADLIDVGGESTRPGAARVPVAEELRRVLPVVAALSAAGAVVSIDTMRAEVARAAVGAGARWVNDVSGGLSDPAMLPTVAELGVGYVAMHWRGQSDVMQQLTHYDDVVHDVAAELARRRDAALAAGIAPDRLVLDPGLGFAKTPEANWTLLAGLDVLAGLGQPLLIGASRKRFLGELLDGREPKLRDDASVAITALLAVRGVWAVRTHTVRAHADAIAVAVRLRREAPNDLE